jgi:hypothetical protein
VTREGDLSWDGEWPNGHAAGYWARRRSSAFALAYSKRLVTPVDTAA